MPALPYPKYGLEKLYLFPAYQSREAYLRATGKEPPPWDPQRQPKGWFDPKAQESARRSVVYDHALAVAENGAPLLGPDGKPFLDLLVLPKGEAATVNLPPYGTNVPGADAPLVPVPCRALDPDEELFFDLGGVATVRNLKLYPRDEQGFTPRDRALLRAMAKKLGVEEAIG